MRVCVRARAQVSADGAIVTERSPSDDAALERLDSIRVLDWTDVVGYIWRSRYITAKVLKAFRSR